MIHAEPPAMTLDDGRIVDANGEIWAESPRYPAPLVGFAVCPKCHRQVAVSRTILGGESMLDADGQRHVDAQRAVP